MLLRLRMLLPYANLEHRFDVPLMERVATLAHVVTIREHKFDVTLMAQTTAICQKNRVKFKNRFVVAGTQQLDSTRKVLQKWKPIAFAKNLRTVPGRRVSRFPSCS